VTLIDEAPAPAGSSAPIADDKQAKGLSSATLADVHFPEHRRGALVDELPPRAARRVIGPSAVMSAKLKIRKKI